MTYLRKLLVVLSLGVVGTLAWPAWADQKPVDLNTATVEQLDALSGIGASKARAIVMYRDEHGPFRSVDDLLEVKGIGDKLLAQLKPQLTVGSASPQGGAAPKAVR